MPILLRILRMPELRDEDVTEGVLRILYDVLCVADGVERARSMGVRNAELVLNDFKNVELLLNLLEGTCCVFTRRAKAVCV